MKLSRNKLLSMVVIDRKMARQHRTCGPWKSYRKKWWLWWWAKSDDSDDESDDGDEKSDDSDDEDL